MHVYANTLSLILNSPYKNMNKNNPKPVMLTKKTFQIQRLRFEQTRLRKMTSPHRKPNPILNPLFISAAIEEPALLTFNVVVSPPFLFMKDGWRTVPKMISLAPASLQMHPLLQ